ncbi:MAG: hypothetical protein GXO18_00170 [Aquificae bacterium]|nr:hypothetical protein [Aquificota bacterium]
MWFEISLGALLVVFVVASYLRGKENYGEDGDNGEENIIVTYSKTIPGYEVKRIFGYIEASVVIPEDEDIHALGEQAVIQKLMDKAREVGANAILELTVSIKEHKVHTKLIARGLAVRV